MKFFAVALAVFAAGVSAHATDAEECSVVTVTKTVTFGHTIPVPSVPATQPLYPTTSVHSAHVPSGTAPASYPHSSGTAAPSGTGAYTAPPPEFTGAAAHVKVAGALAGAGAFAAFFL